MRLLFVADGRSPIARNWIRYFLSGESEVHLISTFECHPLGGLKSTHTVPVAFSGLNLSRKRKKQNNGRSNGVSNVLTSSKTIGLRTFIRHWLGPSTVNRSAQEVRNLISEIQPDLVHAMRIPFEGAIAAASSPTVPLLVSIWGNDFTLHAPASPMMRTLTRRTIERTSALHADNDRDVGLASEWGFSGDRPHLVLPGNGGVRREIFHAGEPGQSEHPELTRVMDSLAPEAPVVVNPRGFRAYVRNDTFFKSIPMVLDRFPSTVFLCPGMDGQPQAQEWIERLQIGDSVHLLPKLTPSDLAVVFRRAQVSVSPSEHDGTPNTLLEAMACGVYPVAGDLQSIREWIDNGKNGTLVDPSNVDQLANATSEALENGELREKAEAENIEVVEKRADYQQGMQRAQIFYERLLN